MSGPDCVWCGMTINAHREHGPAAKTPCGMLKRGFVAAAPEKQRITGEVAAPLVENECCKCKAKLIRRSKSDSYICDDCFDILQSDGGEEALAVKLERAATVKYLRAMAENPVFAIRAQAALRCAATDIEKGEHIP